MPNAHYLTTGELLRAYRRAAGLTQEELAERAAVSARSVSDIERGISQAPHRGTLDGLADALGLSLEERVALHTSARLGRGLDGGDGISAAVSNGSDEAAPSRLRARARGEPRRFLRAAAGTYRSRLPIRFVLIAALIPLVAGYVFMVSKGTRSPAPISAAQPFTAWQVTQVKAAGIGFVTGLASDAHGNLYASTSNIDPRASGVWKIAPSGQVLRHWGRYRRTTIYGNDIALDQHGNVFVADLPHDDVLNISPRGKIVAAWGWHGSTAGKFVQAGAIAVDRHDHVFVGDATGRIQEFTPKGHLLAVWPNCGMHLQAYCHPNDMATDAQGNIYITDLATASLRKVSPTGKALADWGTPGSDPTQFYFPSEIGFDLHGDTFVADPGNGRIHMFSPSGKPLSWWGSEYKVLSCPSALVIDSRSNVYVSDCIQGRIQKYSASGTPFTAWQPFQVVRAALLAPSGMAIDQQGRVFVVTSDSSASMATISPTGQLLHSWSEDVLGAGRGHAPAGAADAGGAVYVVDSAANLVLKLSGAGKVIETFGGEGSGPGQLEDPTAVAVDRKGTVYVSDTGNRRVVTFSPAGTPLGVWNTAPDGTALFLEPRGITVGPRGNVFVADRGKHAVEKLSADGKLLAQWGGSERNLLSEPVGIAVDGPGMVYVTDAGDSRVKAISPNGELVSEWGRKGSQPGEFNQPGAIAVDQHGTLYVADTGNNRIQRLAIR